ncbi:hypothetical protein PG995_006833 [Apiospora arundinis]
MSVNITRTSVLEDGTLPFPTRGPKTIPIPVETEAKFAKNALRGLNLLQTRYDEPINSRSLSSSLEYLYDHLPGKVQGLMTWLSPDDFEMFPEEVDNFDTEGYREYLEKHRRFFDSTYESIRKHEYYIQQVNTKDDHFVTVILHLTKDNPENAGKNDPFTTVDWSAYVDPATGRHISERRVANVRARIAEFLRPALSNIEDRQSHERELWVPRARPADLDWSSGLRATHVLPGCYVEPTCAWTNLEKARDDMVCAAAHQVRRYMGFTPRVTLSLLKPPKHGKEDPAALVRSKLYTPVEIGQYIDDGSDIDDDEESSHLSPSSSDSEDSDEEEEVHMQNVDKVLIDLVGGDEDDDDEENEEEKEEERCQQQSQKQQQESTPLPSKVSSPEPEDVEMTDYDHNSNTQDQKESLVIALEEHEDGAKVAVEDEKEGGVGSDDVIDTPVFFGPQWPHEIPCPPSAAARYLANRLDLQPPQQDITTPNPSVGADFFEVNVEMHTVGGNEEEVQVQSPSSDVKTTVETTSNNEEPQSQQYSTPSSGADGEDRDEFSRSDAPSPESQRQPEAAMDSLSPSPSESLVVVDVEPEVPLTPIPSPVAGPVLSRPASPMEKSAKRKLSVISNYDDSPTTTTHDEEPPAKRQHTTEEDEAPGSVVPEYDPALPILGGLRESQVDPPIAAATAAISRWTAASPTGGQIPGLTLAHEPDAAPAEPTVLETQAKGTQHEDGEKVEETEQSSSGEPPSYIA